jgi:hypothetical protein
MIHELCKNNCILYSLGANHERNTVMFKIPTDGNNEILAVINPTLHAGCVPAGWAIDKVIIKFGWVNLHEKLLQGFIVILCFVVGWPLHSVVIHDRNWHQMAGVEFPSRGYFTPGYSNEVLKTARLLTWLITWLNWIILIELIRRHVGLYSTLNNRSLFGRQWDVQCRLYPPLAVPSAEHPPAWEKIPMQSSSRAKGVAKSTSYTAWPVNQNPPLLENSTCFWTQTM